MAEQEVKFIVRGRFMNGKGEDLGPAPEKHEGEPAPQDQEPQGDDRTVSELTAALEAAGVEIPSGAKKADLQKLAGQHGV